VLGHDARATADLGDVEVGHAMFGEHRCVFVLQAGARRGIVDVDQLPVEDQFGGRQHALAAKLSGHGAGGGSQRGVRAEEVAQLGQHGGVGTQIGEHLAQAGDSVACRVEGAVGAAGVVPAMLPAAVLERDEVQRRVAVADAPDRGAQAGPPANARAAGTT
jgi:hypothetical protein